MLGGDAGALFSHMCDGRAFAANPFFYMYADEEEEKKIFGTFFCISSHPTRLYIN